MNEKQGFSSFSGAGRIIDEFHLREQQLNTPSIKVSIHDAVRNESKSFATAIAQLNDLVRATQNVSQQCDSQSHVSTRWVNELKKLVDEAEASLDDYAPLVTVNAVHKLQSHIRKMQYAYRALNGQTYDTVIIEVGSFYSLASYVSYDIDFNDEHTVTKLKRTRRLYKR